MTIACAAPDLSLGVAIRFSTYLDCQARALGENGFQALAGGPVASGLLSGVVTIFVALIGYRLILGRTPDLRDGVGWVVRLGLVLALATSWPAFQTLIYRVAIDGPGELAAVLLPASGLPSEDLDTRVQMAYDTIRLGSVFQQPSTTGAPGSPGPTQPGQPLPTAQGQAGPQQQPAPPSTGEAPLPQTASVLVISTSGIVAAFRIAIGFLLAIGPLMVMPLLFDATLGVFSGWVRALAGAALALVAATVVTAIDLVMVESELARLQSYTQGLVSEVTDPQALTTIVLLFAVVMLVAVFAAARVASAFRLRIPAAIQLRGADRAAAPVVVSSAALFQVASSAAENASATGVPGQARTAAIADALAAAVRREHGLAAGSVGSGTPEAPSRRVSIIEGTSRSEPGVTGSPLRVAGRRSTGRRTRSAAARDRTV